MSAVNGGSSTTPSLPCPRYHLPYQDCGGSPCALVWRLGTADERRYLFFKEIEIGRDTGDQDPMPGLLAVAELSISRRHCILRQTSDGRCLVRDVSRNGTRLDGRRLVPNLEVEIRSGQTLTVGANVEFVFEAQQAASIGPEAGATTGVAGTTIATVLVGDIRDYTTLVRRAPPREVQRSVSRVFDTLSRAVTAHAGTLKEYQGDAVLAFWEGNFSGAQAVSACRAALALDRLAQELAADRSAWLLHEFPLRIDWALATGPVVLDSFGGTRPTGLSLIGAPVVLAFRLEKFATDETGRILVCPVTKDMANRHFAFRDLGIMHAKGFDEPDHVFALEAERQ